MNGAEANTRFAIISEWRGGALDDAERAAWKHQIWRMDADEFDAAMLAWSRSDKASFRPRLNELWSLVPKPIQATHEPRRPESWWCRECGEPPDPDFPCPGEQHPGFVVVGVDECAGARTVRPCAASRPDAHQSWRAGKMMKRVVGQ
jgi:hypothetical protein